MTIIRIRYIVRYGDKIMNLKKLKVNLPNWEYVLLKVKSIKLSDLAKNSSFCEVYFSNNYYFDVNYYDNIDSYNKTIKDFLFGLEELIRNDEIHLPGIVFQYNTQFGLPISLIKNYLSFQKDIYDSIVDPFARGMLSRAYLSFIKLYYPKSLYDSLTYYSMY